MRGVFERVAEESKGCVSETDFSFASHTTAGIGGAAPLCLYPESVPAAGRALRVLKKYGVPYVVLGSGANVLAADRGFDGAVVSTDRMRTISLGGETVYAESGVRAGAANSDGGYPFSPPVNKAGDDAEYDKRGDARLLALGTACEFSLLGGMTDAAALLDRKYRDALACACRSRGGRLKVRRWV